MTAVAVERTTTDPQKVQRLAAFALAGMALFGLVLEENDEFHDNLQGFIVLGSGILAGLIVGALVGLRPAIRESATRIAWDAVRFVLAYEMIRYGVPKLIGMQFYPQYFRRDKRVIDLASSSLAWEFLGRTYWYQAFGGLIEVGSGVLICFRRTTLLGACLMTTALLNVVLINFFYGVNVKLFASVYLLFDVALIAPHWQRLLALFLGPVDRIHLGRPGRWLYGLTVTLAIVAHRGAYREDAAGSHGAPGLPARAVGRCVERGRIERRRVGIGSDLLRERRRGLHSSRKEARPIPQAFRRRPASALHRGRRRHGA